MENNCKLFVITDLHYFSPSLYSEGAAYRRAESASQKLLNGSRELIEDAFDILAADDFSDTVLIPGDVTCDGEEVSHRELRNLLYRLRERGCSSTMPYITIIFTGFARGEKRFIS